MTPLAVVPIFITAGSAVLPTLLAAVAGAAAILLRPRDLLAAVRRRPLVAMLASTAIAAALAWFTLKPTHRTFAVKPPAAIDWTAVARQIIARQQSEPTAAATAPASQPATVTAASAVVECRGFSRASADGSTGPANLKTLWTYGPEDTIFLATPAVVGNRVYVAGCVSGLGDYTGLLACLDADTGKPIWEITELNGEPLKAFFSSPAVSADGRNVIIGQGFHQDRNCALLCFDAATGKPRWSAASTEHIESSPAIFGDVAVVGVGAIEDHAGRPTGDPGHVMAVRISDGRVLWTAPVIDAESTPAIDADGTVFIGSGLNGSAVVSLWSANTFLRARNTAARATAADQMLPPRPNAPWHTDVGLAVTGTVTLAGDLVVVGAGNGDFAHSNANAEGAVIALDRRSGAVRWRTKLEDSVLGPVAFAGGMLIAPVRTGDVLALDPADGHVLWKRSLSRTAPVLAGCAVTDQFIYALAADGTLAVLERGAGKVLEKHALNDPAKTGAGLASAAPQVAGGRLYVGTETGGVRCLVGAKVTP